MTAPEATPSASTERAKAIAREYANKFYPQSVWAIMADAQRDSAAAVILAAAAAIGEQSEATDKAVGGARRELAAVRKSAGAEGAVSALDYLEEQRVKYWECHDKAHAEGDLSERDECLRVADALKGMIVEISKMQSTAAKSTPGVGAIPTVDELWNALRDVACSTKQKAHRIIMVHKNDVALALAQLRAKPDAFPDAAQPTGKQVGGAP